MLATTKVHDVNEPVYPANHTPAARRNRDLLRPSTEAIPAACPHDRALTSTKASTPWRRATMSNSAPAPLQLRASMHHPVARRWSAAASSASTPN